EASKEVNNDISRCRCPPNNWTGFSPKSGGGGNPQDNISREETAPAGVDVADPGRPGKAFASDSLKGCKTSTKPEQDSSDSALNTQKLSHLRGKQTAPNLALQQVHIVTGYLKHR
uniref:Uncharacterized protein n=1 Tax=Oryza nivara TaxID=4536 RepID=A0A0E0GPG3_ORYNI